MLQEIVEASQVPQVTVLVRDEVGKGQSDFSDGLLRVIQTVCIIILYLSILLVEFTLVARCISTTV